MKKSPQSGFAVLAIIFVILMAGTTGAIIQNDKDFIDLGKHAESK